MFWSIFDRFLTDFRSIFAPFYPKKHQKFGFGAKWGNKLCSNKVCWTLVVQSGNTSITCIHITRYAGSPGSRRALVTMLLLPTFAHFTACSTVVSHVGVVLTGTVAVALSCPVDTVNIFIFTGF